MVWMTLAAPSSVARRTWPPHDKIASGKLTASPMAIAATLTCTWPPR